MKNVLEYEVTKEYIGLRVDVLLVKLDNTHTRSYYQRLIEKEVLFINHKICTQKKYKVQEGDVIKLEIPEPQILEIQPENIKLDIVYEDGSLMIINKPAGMVVHPAPGNYTGTLVNAIMYHCRDNLSSINGILRPGIVHRIDKDTSGLLVVAKNDKAHNSLAQQLKDHSITREYIALVYNNFREDEGTIHTNIGRNPNNRLKQAVIYDGGKEAITNFIVEERYGEFCKVRCILETGRTHQIRVHMSYIKHPLLGDSVYGPEKNKYGVKRQMLHAQKLGFVHPETNRYIEFTSKIPNDMQKIIDILSQNR